MKIRQWLGYNEDASQYLLRPGELRVLNNLQARRPGMLIARKGLTKIYGKYDEETVFGIYRRATILGNPSDFLFFKRVLVPRSLTIAQIAANEEPFEYAWMTMRVIGNSSRVIDTQPYAAIRNFCVAEDRHGRMFLVYGHGSRPRLYRPSDIANVCQDMGLDPPLVAPFVTPTGSGYFIEDVNVRFGGGSYYAPPEITIVGGNPDRPAKLKAIVQGGNVIGVDLIDGGVNYQTPPRLDVAMDKIGTGFRARGNISSGAEFLEGFSETRAATVTGTIATATETYGTTNGTEGNSILYRSRPVARTEKILFAPTVTGTYTQTGTTLTVTTNIPHNMVSGQNASLDFTSGPAVDGVFVVTALTATTFSIQRTSVASPISGNVTVGVTTLTLTTVAGLQPGDIVSMYPAATPFSNSAVFLLTVNPSDSTVTLSDTSWVPLAGTMYEATFRRGAELASAPAEYDADRRRFYANIPLSSSSTTGNGAYATLEFSPTPRGFALNQDQTQCVAVTNNFRTYLYGEYWEGSDYDDKGSAENGRYGGLQASGSQYVLGYSGSVSGRSADVYWPDYSKISVWFCTGVYSTNINQWSRVDVPVTQEINPSTGTMAYCLRFRLRPTARTKTVQTVGGAAVTTAVTPYEQLPDAVPPEVAIYLTHCPESWITDAGQCLPFAVKEEGVDRQQWWSPASSVSRPFVDITPPGTPISATTVRITDTGQGWEQNSLFAFRLYQANPYDQYVDYNTATTEAAVPRSHAAYSTSTQYVEFRLTANAPDTQTPHGPPNFLVAPTQVTIPGAGYTNGQIGEIALYKRSLTAAVSTATLAQTLSWTASQLSQISATALGRVASVDILSKGRNYFSPPTIEVRGGGAGYGLSVIPIVQDGRIDKLQIIDPGLSYTAPPELYTSARAAELTPVMRPAMRGKYRCAYRFVDRTDTEVKRVTATLGNSATTLTLSDTTGVEPDMILEAAALPFNARIKSVNGNQVEINQSITALAANTAITVLVRDMSKPVAYSDLSPIVDVDAGPNDARTHSSELRWSLTGVRPPPRADLVELWRTSADQSLVFYRVEAYGIPSDSGVTVIGTDTLTDEQLFDPDRAFYAAMPVVLPNGNVNAYRFGKPRSDMSVGVAFQDRLWMGVSTSGEGVNTLYYSEFDEFESMPDVNELPIQNNTKSTDVLTSLVPFGSMLLAMQHTHTYAVQYNTDPAIDATIQMMSHRGCLHQRCWDIHENILYAADESGIYSMARNGEVQDISLPIRNFFVGELIDFTQRETFFLQADPRTHILRFFCTLKSQATTTPAMALCYDIQAKTWWTESFPNSITAACTGRPAAARINTIVMGAVDGNVYEIAGDSDHANECLTDTFVANGGSGYREAPAITVPNCVGALVQGVVSEGRLVDVVIQNPGWQARGGLELAAEDGRLLATKSTTPDQDGRVLGGVEYYPIKLNIGPPDAGGVQAVAYANFAVTPRVVRECTVSQGEAFVRLDLARTTQLQPESLPPLETESGGTLLTQNSRPITTEPPPVEIGMEAIGDFLPLNAFVSRIDGKDIYLEHPDGTPALVTNGAPRTNQPLTSPDYLELGGTQMTVTFRKPFRIHIPFRMATGYAEVVNESNARGGGGLVDRSVSLIYTPTQTDKYVELIERYNGREEMRPNLIRRGRGGPGSFVHREDSASTVLNTGREASSLGFATGVAKAKFASQSNSEMTGTDRHLQVELYARPERASPWSRTNYWIADPSVLAPQPFALHGMTVEGVIENGE